eukprot:CAMPEP_0194227424 /NCGR_PEP_ID=MMETSP0156-20130528/42848_1 /TAXON_ID=33649 /ORGANISM="Thalassionema nitzschioides, Strain L26-B" /LENGTH=581 /DNA_ID=CAMNT_0038959905 /DNA_START=62 /DNA_END=1806 /DNA_ORIENTATION=+
MMEEEKDNRPLVKDLSEKHASQLVELRNILEKEESYCKERYDDLWMLRFLLSHKKVSKASAAAISTMNFRKERKINELGDIRHKMINHLEAETSDRNFEIHRKYMATCKGPLAIIYSLPDPDRGLIQIITPAQTDPEKFMKELSFDETMEVYLLANEIIFQVLDDITRRTGKLTKLLKNYGYGGLINELGDIRHKMIDHLEAETSDRNFEIHRKHMKFCHSPLAIIYALPDPDRGLIQILTPKYMDQENFVKEISLEETVEVTLYGNEIIFQVLDDITRRTGKLTKLLRITDLTDYALKDVNLEYLKRHSAATKALEDHYPGLLGSSIVNNPPTWCNATWKVIKHLFPKRVQERVAFVSPNKNPKDAKCFLKYVVRENLWEKFGGNNPEWPPASPPNYGKENNAVFSLLDESTFIIKVHFNIVSSVQSLHFPVSLVETHELAERFLLANEIIFQVLDDITRRTGKLTKLLRIMDMEGYALKDFNRALMKRDAAANKALEDHYPGSLGTCIVIDAPSWINAVWKVVKPLFPKKFVEKIAFADIKNPKDVKYFLKYVTRDKLWERYGGNNPEWPPSPPSQFWK